MPVNIVYSKKHVCCICIILSHGNGFVESKFLFIFLLADDDSVFELQQSYQHIRDSHDWDGEMRGCLGIVQGLTNHIAL